MLTSRKNRINRGHVKSIAHCTKLRRHFTTEWHRAKLKFFSSTVAVVIGRHQYIFMAYYNTYFHQSKIYLSCFRRDGKIRGSINSSVTITNEIILIWHHPRRRSPSPAKRATRWLVSPLSTHKSASQKNVIKNVKSLVPLWNWANFVSKSDPRARWHSSPNLFVSVRVLYLY